MSDPQNHIRQVWWHISVTSAPGRKKQKDQQAKASLSYTANRKAAWDAEDPASGTETKQTAGPRDRLPT